MSPLKMSPTTLSRGRCAGEYVPLRDRTANGYPIWEHTAGSRCWLYSGGWPWMVAITLARMARCFADRALASQMFHFNMVRDDYRY